MSELPRDDEQGAPDPEQILRSLPDGERGLFLAEYRAALDAAHEVWRFRQLREVLARWELVAAAVSRPGYAGALEDARTGRGEYAGLEDVAEIS